MSKPSRAVLRAMYGGRCAYCGCELDGNKWHADHVEPVLRYRVTGHRDSEVKQLRPEMNKDGNYKPACIPCNINKHSMELETWRRHLEALNDDLLRYSGNFRHALRFGLVVESRKPVVFYFEQLDAAIASAGADGEGA